MIEEARDSNTSIFLRTLSSYVSKVKANPRILTRLVLDIRQGVSTHVFRNIESAGSEIEVTRNRLVTVHCYKKSGLHCV